MSNYQPSFADVENTFRKKTTKRDIFLDEMNKAICWKKLTSLIKPYYYKGKRGRKPIGIETMLRMYFLQIWFSLSDEGLEDAIYDSRAFSSFLNISFSAGQQVPDATTLLKFRKIIVENGLDKQILECVNKTLEDKGVIMRGGTIVDATIIEAPTSTKNKQKQRDPEMHQTKKGNEWHFGMKAHIGVDAGSGIVHTAEYSAANESDIAHAHELIRDDDEVLYGDSGYLGLQKRKEIQLDKHLRAIEYKINLRPSQIKGLKDLAIEHEIEKRKASVRSKVEHPFHIVKNQFGYKKCAYKGIKKNAARLNVSFALANIVMVVRAKRPDTGLNINVCMA